MAEFTDRLGNPLAVGDEVVWISPEIGVRAEIERFTRCSVVIKYHQKRPRKPGVPQSVESCVSPHNLVLLYPPVDDPVEYNFIVWSNYDGNDGRDFGSIDPGSYTVELNGYDKTHFVWRDGRSGLDRADAYVQGYSAAMGVTDQIIQHMQRIV